MQKYKGQNIKYLLLFILIIGFNTRLIYSQDTLSTDWVLIQSSPLTNGNAEAWAIGTDQSGGLLWGVNMDMPGVFEFMDALVFKLDEDGKQIWLDTAVSGTFAQQTYNLKVTDSFVYAGGRTCSSIGTDNCDLLFFTTDLHSGETGWTFVWDQGYGYEEVDGISLHPDGIYLTGWSVGNGTKVDVLVMKIDYSGKLIWQNTWGGIGARDDHQDGHIVVDDSMIYVSGLYNGTPNLGWEGSALLAKFDKNNGNFVDSLTYGRQDTWSNAENALGMTSDGIFLYVTGYTTTSLNNWDIFVGKFDKNLNQIWYKTWGGSSDAESARAISVVSDGSIYIGGTTKSYGNGNSDMVLLKFDSSGNLQWYKTWGKNLDDHALDIHIHGNHLYMTGRSNSFHPNQKSDAVLLKIEIDSISAVPEKPEQATNNYYFYPNPMNLSSELHFNPTEKEAHQLFIYDLTGKKRLEMDHITSGKVKIEKKDFTSGVFFFELWNSKGRITAGKLIIK